MIMLLFIIFVSLITIFAMKHMKFLSFFLGVTFSIVACSSNNEIIPVPDVDPDGDDGTTEVEFAKGADIGWVTEYESKGYNFYNAKGEQRECTALMKELGLNAIRIRVWVDPSKHGNWCNTADVVEKAKRAKELGMDVMIDFHYSDWWADPAQQNKPASWVGKNLANLKSAIKDAILDGVIPNEYEAARAFMMKRAAKMGISYKLRATSDE